MWCARKVYDSDAKSRRSTRGRSLFLSRFLFNRENLSVSDHVTISRHFTVHKVSFVVEFEWDSAFDRIRCSRILVFLFVMYKYEFSWISTCIKSFLNNSFKMCTNGLRDSEFTNFCKNLQINLQTTAKLNFYFLGERVKVFSIKFFISTKSLNLNIDLKTDAQKTSLIFR